MKKIILITALLISPSAWIMAQFIYLELPERSDLERRAKDFMVHECNESFTNRAGVVSKSTPIANFDMALEQAKNNKATSFNELIGVNKKIKFVIRPVLIPHKSQDEKEDGITLEIRIQAIEGLNLKKIRSFQYMIYYKVEEDEEDPFFTKWVASVIDEIAEFNKIAAILASQGQVKTPEFRKGVFFSLSYEHLNDTLRKDEYFLYLRQALGESLKDSIKNKAYMEIYSTISDGFVSFKSTPKLIGKKIRFTSSFDKKPCKNELVEPEHININDQTACENFESQYKQRVSDFLKKKL